MDDIFASALRSIPRLTAAARSQSAVCRHVEEEADTAPRVFGHALRVQESIPVMVTAAIRCIVDNHTAIHTAIHPPCPSSPLDLLSYRWLETDVDPAAAKGVHIAASPTCTPHRSTFSHLT